MLRTQVEKNIAFVMVSTRLIQNRRANKSNRVALCTSFLSVALSSVTISTATAGGPTFESSGVQAVMGKVSIQGQHIMLSVVLKNISKLREYFLLFGPYTVALDTGEFPEIERVSGFEACEFSRTSDSAALHDCRDKAKDLSNYTYIEPGEIAIASLRYGWGLSQDLSKATTVSFTLKSILRSPNATVDPLADASTAKDIGPPRVVNFNFSLIPTKASE